MRCTLLVFAIAISAAACGKKEPLDAATKQKLVAHKDALCACTKQGGAIDCAAELDRTAPAPRVSGDALSDEDRLFVAEVLALEGQCRRTLDDLAQFMVDVRRADAEREEMNQSLRAIDQLRRDGALGDGKAAHR